MKLNTLTIDYYLKRMPARMISNAKRVSFVIKRCMNTSVSVSTSLDWRETMFNKVKSDLKVGDSVLMNVGGQPYVPTITAITNEAGNRVRLDLDWGKLGKSRVYMHDEGKVWSRLPAMAASA